MNSRELHRWVGEYPTVLRRAGEEGWLAPLVLAHLTPIDKSAAVVMAHKVVPGITVTLRHGKRGDGVFRGRARFNRRRGEYAISLPTQPGSRACTLRVGLVIHEAAHVHDRRKVGKFGHGPTFCNELRRLLSNWSPAPMTTSYKAIYARHRGPYSLLLTREVQQGKKLVQETDRVSGPMSAEEAHEEARTIVNRASDNVLSAFVFSDGEGAFIGAWYERGKSYRPWHEEEEAFDDRLDLPEPAPIPVVLLREEPPAEKPAPRAKTPRPAPALPVAAEAKPRTARATLGFNLEKLSEWPDKPAPRLLREAIEQGGPGTAIDLAERIKDGCLQLGMAFPASMVSRLKQAGFLVEVPA